MIGRGLTTLDELVGFDRVDYLDISHNSLTSISHELSQIMYFKCQSNNLTYLPVGMNNMIYINCKDNDISVIDNIRILKRLECNSQMVTKISRVKHLISIDPPLTRENYPLLDDESYDYVNITINDNINKLHNFIKNFTHEDDKTLDIANSCITYDIIKDINFSHITELDIRDNFLTQLPATLQNLKRLLCSKEQSYYITRKHRTIKVSTLSI